MTKVIFRSFLADRFHEFVNLKLSLGYKYLSKASALEQLDRLCLELGGENGLSKTIVTEWIKKRPMEVATTQAIRIRLVQEFAAFLQKCGESAYLLPKQKIDCKTSFTPYVFSHEQIQNIFTVLDNKKPHIAHPICNILELSNGLPSGRGAVQSNIRQPARTRPKVAQTYKPY